MSQTNELLVYGSIKLYSGTASQELSLQVADYLGEKLCGRDIVEFPNENLFVKLHSSVRGQDVYIIQHTAAPVHRNLMELLILLQTLRLDSAARITAVVPYLCYGRSDKKDQPRVPITSRLVADLIQTAGADRYMTLDPHAYQIQGFFSIPGDVLNASHILDEYIRDNLRPYLRDPVVVTVDLGYAKRGRNFATRIDAPIAFIEKRRVANDAQAEALTIIGDVKNRDVILVDDEVDTGRSTVTAVNLVKEYGAKRVYMAFVHPIFSADAAQRLAALPVTEYITTDSVPISQEKREIMGKRLTVLSVASLLGEVIRRAHEGRSVGQMFNE
jgi:ribose-phosphate pyrophosphokinase